MGTISTDQQIAWRRATVRWPDLVVRIKLAGDHTWVAFDAHDHILGAVQAP